MERHLRKRSGRLVLEESKESLFTESRLLSLFDGRIVELRAFVAENAWGVHRARPRISVHFVTFHPLLFLHGFDVLLPFCRSRQMKALFRRIDKINRVAHDNADNFATIRTRPSSGACTNKYPLAGNAREKRDISRVEIPDAFLFQTA